MIVLGLVMMFAMFYGYIRSLYLAWDKMKVYDRVIAIIGIAVAVIVVFS